MRKLGVLILFVAVAGSTTLYAQTPVLPVSSIVSASSTAEPEAEAVRLTVGRSTVVNVGSPIARVSLTSADVADAMVTGPTELLLNGKVPGTISMFVWNRAGTISKYEVTVSRDLARLNGQIKELLPGEEISVQSNGKSVVLSGLVSKKEVIERAVDLAAGYVERKDDVVTLLQIRDGGASNQVLLRVRFAEVSRTAITELGSSFFTGISGYKDYVGRSTTQQFPAPNFDPKQGQIDGLVFSDYLNLFLFNTKEGLGTVIKALTTKGLFQSLAEPNLVAESGKEASFLAGGEIPVPVAQGAGASLAISVQWKEFGIRLNFLPTVNGDRVHLKVRPEVSTLDFGNAIVLNGFRIPALSTRRTETELELANGQTFAISGLMNNSVSSTMRKIPGIGDIPILGLLFQSKAAQKEQTELVVMITPEILPNNSAGVTNRLPHTPERFMEPLPNNRLYQQPEPAFKPNGATRSPDNGTPRPASEMSQRIQPSPAPAAEQNTPVPVANTAPAGTPDARTAAATVSALSPQSRSVIQDSAPAATPANAVTRPLSGQDQKAVERARKQEEVTRVAAAKAAAQQARAQAKIDAEAARRAAEQAKRDAEVQKKKDKALAEAEAKRQQAMKEAEEKLKAAQASYQLELSKHQK